VRPPRPPAGCTAPAPALGLDYHNHLLPGVDDGAADFAQALTAISGLQALGFAGAVLTPHIYHGVFDNNAADLRRRFDSFTAALRQAGVAFALHLAAEYFADAQFLRLIKEAELLAAPHMGERLVLLEFSQLQQTPFAEPCLAALVSRGYRPVIAHVERYRFVDHAQADWLERFEGAGAVLQGDVGSLAGQHGLDVQLFARRLAERGLVRIWGTDLHHSRQLKRHIVPGLAWLASIGRLDAELSPYLTGVAP
jgi:tyrosine-protein phosphatase YwqE